MTAFITHTTKHFEMEEEFFCKIRSDLLLAEEQFSLSMNDGKDIRAVSRAIKEMRKFIALQIEDGEDTTGITALLTKTESKFRTALKPLENDRESSPSQSILDFGVWAHELQCALRLQDPLLLSIESESVLNDDGSEYESVKNERGLTAKIFEHISPLDKHGDKELKLVKEFDGKRFRKFNKMTMLAWCFAVICLLITLVCLTKDFIHSQLNPGIRMEQVAADVLSAPAITVCNQNMGQPSFLNFPTKKYPGHPLFGISRVQNMHNGLFSDNVFKSDNGTGISPYITPIYKGPGIPKCKNELGQMSINRARSSLFKYKLEKNISLIGVPSYDQFPCYQCFTFGAEHEQKLSKGKHRSTSDMPLSMEVFSSRIMAFCQLRQENTSPFLKTFFDLEFKAHFGNLTDAGILFVPKGLSEQNMTKLFQSSDHFYGRNLQEFFCSVYFFAGYFYPSEDAGNVRYEWSKAENKWNSIPGTRTYLAGTVGKSTSGSRNYNYAFGPGHSSLLDIEYGMGIEVNYEEPEKAVLREGLLPLNAPVSFIDGPSVTKVYFNRRNEDEQGTIYDAEITTLTDQEETFEKRYLQWSLGYDYRDFTTTKRSTQPSMSWPEFMTDIFEYIGLFTGKCIHWCVALSHVMLAGTHMDFIVSLPFVVLDLFIAPGIYARRCLHFQHDSGS